MISGRTTILPCATKYYKKRIIQFFNSSSLFSIAKYAVKNSYVRKSTCDSFWLLSLNQLNHQGAHFFFQCNEHNELFFGAEQLRLEQVLFQANKKKIHR